MAPSSHTATRDDVRSLRLVVHTTWYNCVDVAMVQEPVPTNLIGLRAGDPIVQALKVAGQEPLAILRVLPVAFRRMACGPVTIAAIESGVRADLAEFVGRRLSAPRLEVRFGDPVEQVALLAAETRAGRVIAANDFARQLSRALRIPVISAERGAEVDWRDMLAGIRAQLPVLGRPVNEKLAALRRMDLFGGVGLRELEQLASQLDVAEVGPGYVLISERRLNDALWILLEGSAARSIRGREIGRLGRGSLIGAPSMIYGQPAVATVTAVEPIRALVAGRAQFRVISAIDAVALRMKAAAADRLREYLRADERATASAGGWRLPAVAH
jgi:cyclic nucleotide-binding protein